MITKVVIFNEETREGRDNFGDVDFMELNGKQFSYIVRQEMDFRQLFNYLSSCNDWVAAPVKPKKA